MLHTPVNHTTQNTSQLTKLPQLTNQPHTTQLQLTSQPHTTLKTDVVILSLSPASNLVIKG